MPKLPPIPAERRSFDAGQPRDRLRSAEPHRLDDVVGLRADEDGRRHESQKPRDREGEVAQDAGAPQPGR